MPRGDKRRYTPKQERQADHIEESFRRRGVKDAEGRAWAVVNAIHGGGEYKGGGGYGKPENKAVYRKAGRKGAAARRRKTANRRPSTKKTGGSRVRTRKARAAR